MPTKVRALATKSSIFRSEQVTLDPSAMVSNLIIPKKVLQLTCSSLALVNYTVEGNVTNGVGVVADPQNPTTVWTPGAGNKQLITVEVYQIVPAGNIIHFRI
jgi:hypothetical protein